MAITKTTNLSLQKIDAAEKLSDFPSVQAQNMDVLDAQVAKKADKSSVPTKISDLTNDSGFLTSVSKADVGLGNVANLDQSKAVRGLTISGTTLTATALDGTTQRVTLPSSGGSGGTADGNTTYTLSKSGQTITLTGSDGSTSSVTDSVGSGGGASELTPATTTALGGVKVGKGLTIDYTGLLSVTGSTSEPVMVKQTWPVTYSLTNASCSPSPATVTDGQSYTLTFTVGDGYEFDGTPTVRWTDTSGQSHTVSATNGSATFTASAVSGGVTVTAKGKEKAVTPVEPSGDVPSEIESQSWAQLSALAKGKTASELSSLVGLEKTVAIDGYGDHKFRVVGVGHDKQTGSTANTITFECVDIVAMHNMNSSNTTEGGWEKCTMRSWLASDLLPKLPSDLRSVIVAVDKHNTPNYGEETTSDKLWLESMNEVGKTGVNDGASTTYDYWSKHNSNSEQVKNNGSSAASWWLRSVIDATYFYRVSSSGDWNGRSASYSLGVAPCFCI